MNLKHINKQKGFTMIELVIIIAILGILAAFALPRFANFTEQAKNASSESIAGTLNSAIGIANAKRISSGSFTVDFDDNPATTDDRINMSNVGTIATLSMRDDTTCRSTLNALVPNNNLEIKNLRMGFCQITGNGINVELSVNGARAISN